MGWGRGGDLQVSYSVDVMSLKVHNAKISQRLNVLLVRPYTGPIQVLP
jgi:hypothetical protein